MFSSSSAAKSRSSSKTDWNQVLSSKRTLITILCVVFATLVASLIYIWNAQTNLEETAKVVTTIIESILLLVIAVSILFVQAGFFRMMYNQEGMRYPTYISVLFGVVALISLGISVTALSADASTIPSDTTRLWLAGTSGLVAALSAATALYLRTTLIGVNYEALLDYAGKETYAKDLLSPTVFKSDDLEDALSATDLTREQIANLVNSATYGQFLLSAKNLLSVDEMKRVNQLVKTAADAKAQVQLYTKSVVPVRPQGIRPQSISKVQARPVSPAQLLQSDDVPTQNPFVETAVPTVPQISPTQVPQIAPTQRASPQLSSFGTPGQAAQLSSFGTARTPQSAVDPFADLNVDQTVAELQNANRELTSDENRLARQLVQIARERAGLRSAEQNIERVEALADAEQMAQTLADMERPQLLTDIQRGFAVPDVVEPASIDVDQYLRSLQRTARVPSPVRAPPPRPRGYDFTPAQTEETQILPGQIEGGRKWRKARK